MEDFSKPKILWKRVGSILRFCYNDNESLGLDSTCFATGENIEFICCVLNSPMGHCLFKDAPKAGTGDLLVSVQAIEPIQIPQVGLETNSEFKKLLEWLIKTDSLSNEKEISRKVWRLMPQSLHCISFDSYIKPQPPFISGSDNTVVYLSIPTSNHNLDGIGYLVVLLYIFRFLHQTTTLSIAG